MYDDLCEAVVDENGESGFYYHRCTKPSKGTARDGAAVCGVHLNEDRRRASKGLAPKSRRSHSWQNIAV